MVFECIEKSQYTKLERHLKNRGQDINLLSTFNRRGYTPLHEAAYKSQERAIEILINYVLADTDDQSELICGGSGETIDYAAIRNQKRRALEKRKEALKSWLNLNSLEADSFTALHFATFRGHLPMIKLLIANGADIHAVNRKGINMLHVAA